MKCTIDIAPSGNLVLEIPSVLAEGRLHTVEVPFTLAGLSLIKQTLSARRADPRPSLGKRSAPVASQVHQFIERQTQERDRGYKSLLADIELDL